jgi:hypothetical protein
MNRRGIVRFLCFSVIGVLYQAVFLAAFMSVAQTEFAEVGKPLVVGATILSSALLVWIWVHSIKKTMWIILVPASLAVGYTIAFHLVGVALFPGLLSDFYAPFLDNALSVLRVTANVFVTYGIGIALIVLLQRSKIRVDIFSQSKAH